MRFINFGICLFTVVSVAFSNQEAKAAACCARSSATPSLIVTDDESQVNFGFSLASVAAEPASAGIPVWLGEGHSEVNQNFRFDAATLVSDRFQIGGGLVYVNHKIGTPDVSGSNDGFGDLRLNAGYEFMPSWSYSTWRPTGYLFTALTVPLGKSIYESQAEIATDVTGNGFYSLSLGAFFVKRWSTLDLFFIPEAHYSLPRTFDSSEGTVQVIPGFGASFGLGAGISPWAGPLRIGARYQPRFDQPRSRQTASGPTSGGSWIMNTDIGVDISYLVRSLDSVILSYTDQTLIGPALNSNLSRIFAISLQHRWQR